MTRFTRILCVLAAAVFLYSFAFAQESTPTNLAGSKDQAETTQQDQQQQPSEQKEEKKEEKKEAKQEKSKVQQQKGNQQQQQQPQQQSQQAQQGQTQQKPAEAQQAESQKQPAQPQEQKPEQTTQQKTAGSQQEQQAQQPTESQKLTEQAAKPAESKPATPAETKSEPAVEKQAEASAKESKEKKKEKKGSWFSLALTYQFMHNLAKERPTATNLISIDPRFKLPYGFKASVHLGASWTAEYGRTTSTTDEADWDYRNAVSNKTFHTVDFDVTVITLARKIAGYKFNDKFAVGASGAVSLFVPYTSRFQGIVPKWYFAYKPSLKGYVKLGDFRLSDAVAFQQNFHEADFRIIEQAGLTMLPAVQFAVSNSLTLSWSKWGVSAMGKVGTKRSWFYTYDLDPLYERAAELDYSISERVSWTYTVELGYSFSELKKPVLEHFSISAGFTTAGPERRNGGFGNDRVYPFDPLFTTFYLGITASL